MNDPPPPPCRYNAVTEGLLFSIVSASGIVIHQTTEMIGMIVRTTGYHEALYKPGTGLLAFCLTTIGFGIVITNLKIPLLWIQISSSGLSKSEGDKKKKKAFRRVNYASIFFIVTFIGGALILGHFMMGAYSIVWFCGFIITYNVGGRKIVKQLQSNDKDGKYQSVIDCIKTYVKQFSVAVSCGMSCKQKIINHQTESWKEREDRRCLVLLRVTNKRLCTR